jgi:tRNA threonylcarbamoyladenosine biosynthesis protein TsaE
MSHGTDHTYLADEKATEAFGAKLASALTPGLVIWLVGDLGAGKTTLTRGLLRALGHTGSVKSPTYTLMEIYQIPEIPLYHFDFYRFTHPDEFLEAGLDEYFGREGVCLVEWADKALPFVPQADLEIRMEVEGEGRQASLNARSQQGLECLKNAQLTC